LFGLAGFYGVVGMADRSLPLGVARILDRFREEHLSAETDWKPLESVLPAEWCGGFTWMSRVTQGETVIDLYKHGITRRYLNLDHNGGAWRYDHQENVYRPQPLDTAIEAVYEGIELCGADRSADYDTPYIDSGGRRPVTWELERRTTSKR